MQFCAKSGGLKTNNINFLILFLGVFMVTIGVSNEDGRPQPNDVQAERSILGTVLLDNAAIHRVTLGPGEFYSSLHSKMFARMQVMIGAAQPVDLTTLSAALHTHGELAAAGGTAYIASLMDGVPRVSNIEHYAAIVHEKSQLRRASRTSNTMRPSSTKKANCAARCARATMCASAPGKASSPRAS